MDGLTFLSNLVGSLAWPSALIVTVLIFRKDIQKLIPALRALRYRELELDFGRRVSEVEERAEQRNVLPKEAPTVSSGVADPFNAILKIAAVSPAAAVVEAWRVFENTLREIARSKNLDVSAALPAHRLLKDLRQRGHLSEDLLETAESMRRLRNDAAHSVTMYLSSEDATEYVEVMGRLTSALTQRT